MRRRLLSVLVGLIVAIVVWFDFGLNTWTVIHSGWSESAVEAFFIAARAVPVLLGVLAAWWSYRMMRA